MTPSPSGTSWAASSSDSSTHPRSTTSLSPSSTTWPSSYNSSVGCYLRSSPSRWRSPRWRWRWLAHSIIAAAKEPRRTWDTDRWWGWTRQSSRRWRLIPIWKIPKSNNWNHFSTIHTHRIFSTCPHLHNFSVVPQSWISQYMTIWGCYIMIVLWAMNRRVCWNKSVNSWIFKDEVLPCYILEIKYSHERCQFI